MQFLSMIGQSIDSYNSVIPHDAEDRMHRICQKMHHEYTANHPISYYSDACFLSESRFSHAFKAYTGRSPKAYLLLLRADYAVRLLETTNLSLQEISNQIGIDDTNYFSRLIKKHTGYPPLHFRKNRE